MHANKVFLIVGALAVQSLAQTFADESCSSSWLALEAAAPQPASEIFGILPDPASILRDPSGYASALCAAASELPPSGLSDFAEWGQSLLHFASVEISSYDALATSCFNTNSAEGAAATSYLHSIVSQTAPLCVETTVSSTKGCQPNASATITSLPKRTPMPLRRIR
ncbi:hypothetical protein F5B22DRAFT_596442 [Xylaria bambusicola]|uniref:uncharacterized protein n=1 Tax=Xylaria bambusicola TaxID=326684 RepID=UPI002007B28A|nr:uncharacterized protein F5B22DRAFT_596442 [Xylaria bambusicola]KAI0521302.1 hypothetical protein F5B22DRAFT_596442 [Xylaria bambusicola]